MGYRSGMHFSFRKLLLALSEKSYDSLACPAKCCNKLLAKAKRSLHAEQT